MLGSLVKVLASFVTEPKILGAWLIVLSLAAANNARETYIAAPKRAAEKEKQLIEVIAEVRTQLAVSNTKIDAMTYLLAEINKQSSDNALKMDDVRSRLARVEGKLENGKK